MRIEAKRFFADKKDILNKGFSPENSNIKKSFGLKDAVNLLPEIKIISEYESLYPGTLKAMFEVVNTEQANQYKLEKDKINSKNMDSRYSNVCRLLMCAAICLTTYKLAIYSTHTQSLAFKFCLISFTSMFGISLLQYVLSLLGCFSKGKKLNVHY